MLASVLRSQAALSLNRSDIHAVESCMEGSLGILSYKKEGRAKSEEQNKRR